MSDTRNHASGSTWGAWEGEDIERLLADVEKMSKEARLPSGQETRVVSSTGGEKGSKLARFDLIPEDVMWLLAEHYGRGARKYADRNWEKGYDWGLSYAACRRHMKAFWTGEDFDLDPSLYPEGMTDEEIAALPDDEKALHVVAFLWHAVALTAFATRGIGVDSRPS